MTVCTGYGRTFILIKSERCERMLWFRIPEKIYFKKGCMEPALDELKAVYNKKKAFIVTDSELYKNGYVNAIEKKLKSIGIQYTIFSDIKHEMLSEVTFDCIEKGAKAMCLFEPDTIIALGTYRAADSAKLMRVLYEKPDIKIRDLAENYRDVRNTNEIFSKENQKSFLVVIPVLYGNGSEVTPYAAVTDEMAIEKYAVENYSLMPDMSIIDSDFYTELPEHHDCAPGFTQLALALSAYISEYSSEYTDSFAIKAVKRIFDYLPFIYKSGEKNIIAEEKISEASAMAGIASANTDKGLCCTLADSIANKFDQTGSSEICAVILPCVMRYLSKNDTDIDKKLSELAKIIGLNETEELISEIEKLRDKCCLARSISELKIGKDGYFSIIEKISSSDIKAALEEAYD